MGSRYFIFTILVLFYVAYTSAATCGSCNEPLYSFFPPKYDPSLEPANPLDLTGMNAIVTGDSKGQGHAIATLLTQQGVNVYGIARTKENDIPNMTWNHYKGDITKESDVKNFIKKLTKPNQWNVTRIHIMILNAGRVGYIYIQDNDVDTITQPIETNFLGNYRVWDMARRAGLLPETGYTRVGWTSSVSAFSSLDAVEAYGYSKTLIVDHVKRMVIRDTSYGSEVFTFTIAPDRVITNISCNSYLPKVKTEVCSFITTPIRQNGCPTPLPPDTPNGPTLPVDVAKFYLTILRDPAPVYNIRVIEATAAKDPCGNKWERWIDLWNNCNPGRMAEIWTDEFMGFFPPCSAPPAPK
jgi:NAD(P)-dependent dehydrogenase (short-subunit alcohol dehydrogenase family)